MSYVEKNVLQNGETILKRVEMHPLRLVFAWIWGILGFWLIFIPTIKAIKLSIYYKTTEFVITNKKVIEKYGVVSSEVACEMAEKGRKLFEDTNCLNKIIQLFRY